MKLIPKFKGGRRHFHVILFILLSFISVASSSTTQHVNTSLTNSSQTSIEDSTFVLKDSIVVIEYRTPEELQIQKLYQLITQVSSISNKTERRELAQAVYTYGTQYSIDPLILLAIAKIQSNFRKTIMGYGNCYGYFQINLNVHKISKTFKTSTIEQTKKACQIYNYYYKLHRGNITRTLNGYNGNASSKNKYAGKVLQAYNNYKQKLKGM